MSRPAGEARIASYGRGGAGNLSSKGEAAASPADLETPTIKSANYTTGRGGAGNMAANGDPSVARAAQDVATPNAHTKEMHGTHHWGRGGEGNMTTVGNGDKRNIKNGERTSSFGGMVEKGKEFLGLNKKKAPESAIED